MSGRRSRGEPGQHIITVGRKGTSEKAPFPLVWGENRGPVSQPPAEEEWCVSTRGCLVKAHIYYTMRLDHLSTVWYNVCMDNRGGARPGAGRPRSIDKNKGEVVAQKLQTAFQDGLAEIGKSLPQLVKASVKSALGEGKEAGTDRRFLVKLYADLVKITEDDKTPYAQMMQQWVQQVQVNVDGESRGRIEVSEPRTIPGTAGSTIPSE
jgi:hypothetical protein